VATAGYSGTPLAKKLGLKPDMRLVLLHAPEGYASTLGPLPDGLDLRTRLARSVDLVQLFVTEAAFLAREFAPASRALRPAGALWVSWPKGKGKAKIPTDLDEGIVRTIGLDAGLVDVKVCAVDEVWSGLKFVRRVRDR
jgi:hypothetical protein